MKQDDRLITQISRLFVLFLSAISAHEIAGGSIVDFSHSTLQFLAIGIILTIFQRIELEGPSLALLILLIQSSSHFILGGGSHKSELSMTIGHLLSGVFSYFVISHFEANWSFITSLFMGLFPLKSFPRILIAEVLFQTARYCDLSFRTRQLLTSMKFRAPPTVLEI